MRIGLVASVGEMIDSFFVEIIEEWRNAGNTVLTATGPDLPVKIQDGVTLIPGITRRPSTKNFQAKSQLRSWVAQNNIAIVVTNAATGSLLVRAAGLTVPVVYFCHGLHWQSHTRLSAIPWVTAERWALRRTAGILTLNSDDDQWFRTHTTKPVHRLRQGVGLDLTNYQQTPMPAYDNGVLKLVWIGELTPRKRPVDAVRTIANLHTMGIDAELDLLGAGDLSTKVAAVIDQLGLNDKVRLQGLQPVTEYFAKSHALMHTATWEGLPRVGLESVAIGRAMLAYDTKGTRDIPGVILSPQESPDSLAGTIATWVNNGLQPPAVPREHLSYQSAAKQILDFLNEVKQR